LRHSLDLVVEFTFFEVFENGQLDIGQCFAQKGAKWILRLPVERQLKVEEHLGLFLRIDNFAGLAILPLVRLYVWRA